MAFRYKFRTLSVTDEPRQVLDDIFPNGNSFGRALAGDALIRPWETVLGLLHFRGARCLLIQAGIRDPDFLEEHQAFYAKQHRPVSRKCVRLHAFALDAPDVSDEASVLEFLHAASNAPDAYLGFVTVRPLRHAPVGATIISPPPNRFPTVHDDFPVHIAGLEFKITGTPFLQQDNAVGACAQASIWMALRTLRRRQGNAAFSPAELTVAATRYLSTDRTFPGRSGLTIEQMLEAVRFAGHDPLHLTIPSGLDPHQRDNAVLQSSVPYIESGLPVIVALEHPSGGHAVVAIGLQASSTSARVATESHEVDSGQATLRYAPASNWIKELCIHNDNTGPYQRLGSGAPHYYMLEHATSLIVTLPDGIFTTAAEAELLAVRALVRASVFFAAAAKSPTAILPEIDFAFRTILCARHPFRRWALEDQTFDPVVRDRYRTHELPRYMWVIEIHDVTLYDPLSDGSCSRCGEIVLDASADPFHADALLFARVSKFLWPSLTGVEGLLLSEDDEGVEGMLTATADLGPTLKNVW